jgi:hypothetical protein
MRQEKNKECTLLDFFIDIKKDIPVADCLEIIDSYTDEELVQVVMEQHELFNFDCNARKTLQTTSPLINEKVIDSNDQKLKELVRAFVNAHILTPVPSKEYFLAEDKLSMYLVKIGFYKRPGAEDLKRRLKIAQALTQGQENSHVRRIRDELIHVLKLN